MLNPVFFEDTFLYTVYTLIKPLLLAAMRIAQDVNGIIVSNFILHQNVLENHLNHF